MTLTPKGDPRVWISYLLREARDFAENKMWYEAQAALIAALEEVEDQCEKLDGEGYRLSVTTADGPLRCSRCEQEAAITRSLNGGPYVCLSCELDSIVDPEEGHPV